MSKENKKINIEVYPQEKELINYLRNRFRFGIVEIKMRDGLPVQILKHTEYQDLTPRDNMV